MADFLSSLNQNLSEDALLERTLPAEHKEDSLYFRYLVDRVAGEHIIRKSRRNGPTIAISLLHLVRESTSLKSDEFSFSAKDGKMDKPMSMITLLWDEH